LPQEILQVSFRSLSIHLKILNNYISYFRYEPFTIIEGFYDWSRYFTVFLFFVFTLLSFRTIAQDFILKTLVVSGAVLATIGLFQSFGWGFSWIPGMWKTRHATLVAPYATMVHKNVFASVALVLFPFSVVSVLNLSSWWRYVSLYTTVAILTAILLTSARAAWVGFAMALTMITAIFLILAIKHKFIVFKSRNVGIIAGVVLVVFALLCGANAYLTRVDQPIRSRIKSIPFEDNLRIELWQDTIKMVKETPVGGVGLGNWKTEFPKYMEFPKYFSSVRDPYWFVSSCQIVRPHNDFLWILAEVGVIGFLIYLTLITIQFKYLIQSVFASNASKQRLTFLLGVLFATTAYLVNSMFSFPRERIYVSMLFAMCLALATHMAKPKSVKSYFTKITQLLTNRIISTTIYALLLVVFALTIQRTYADGYGKTAQYYHAQKDWKMVIASSTKAIDHWMFMDAMNIPMHWYRGVAHFERGEIQRARNDFEKAYRYNPNNLHVLNNLATTYEMAGRHEEAIKLYQSVLTKLPRFIWVKVNLGASYYNSGNFIEAERVLVECLEQVPNSNKIKQYLAETRKMILKQLKQQGGQQ